MKITTKPGMIPRTLTEAGIDMIPAPTMVVQIFLASLLFCYNIGSDCKILDRLSSGFLFKNYTVRVRA
ncbi:hypothetical protein QQP08_004660 [Theobroma cacao]|nr:hypothetical protein QQP08_004660 [Theobroma cacao]